MHLVLALLPPRPGDTGRCHPQEVSTAVTRAASLAVPALLLSIAAGLAVATSLPDWLAVTLRAAPLVVFGGGALLGLLLRQGRLALGLVVLALADLALVRIGGGTIFAAVGLLLPLNLGVMAWLPEANLLTPRGASRLVVILLQAGVVMLLQLPELAAVAASLEQPFFPTTLSAWTTVPQPALVAFAVAHGLALARFLKRGRPLSAGAAWAVVASFIALDSVGAGRPASVYLVIAGLLIASGAALEPRRVAYADRVTGLPGRLALHEALRRLPRRYALARVDIDEFRTFREEHGADAARRMVQLVAGELARVRGGGRPFYCETHAFAVLFRRTSAAVAARHLELVRRAIEAATLDVRIPGPPREGRPTPPIERTVAVTVSIGVVEPDRRGADPHEVLLAAEHALDRAKQAGQNRISGPAPDWPSALGAG
jgi:diguanylate cyclase (GGDEF)-like protein